MVRQAIVRSEIARARIRSSLNFRVWSNDFLRLLLCKDKLRVDFDFCGKRVVRVTKKTKREPKGNRPALR